ncbi:DEAD/DEAH box helicase [Hyphomicrobium denitrificans]|uniref:DEAD/DEAH box helicase n=1 Tax=Hyphomicrobium denitrificans TaxID=53399 RepID=UPI00030F8CD1|nr:DEAD/DEAH box helicase [Hyphomicrobium denitrificans]
MTVQTFEAFGFAEPLSRALTQCGYVAPTPIQVQALPPQLEGRDLLGMAETGSGKTATFVLPILQKIASQSIESAPKQVLALVLAPTRELAIQIDQEVASLARNMRIRRAVVLGGVSKGPQINALKRGVHVLVATPGRLLDLVNMRTCDLSRVDTLVLDEADRMFDMGFIRDIKKIVALLPAVRRTALFSATMPAEIKKFAYEVLKDPYRVDLSPKSVVVDRIDQKVMIVRTPEKQSRLHTILSDEACKRVIVFTRTKRGADRVADRLGMASISASAFHGNKAQNARQRALNDFMMGHIRVLVATDIAARGIDVSNITHVVNFDMPLDPETYVHRVGRTARKGNSGIAISLCDPSERQEIAAIERLMKQKLEVIADVGGEALPMPERRPHHHAENGSRREGGRHNDRRRDGGHRGDGHVKHRRGDGRSIPPSAARHADNGHEHQRAAIAAEGEAMFGVGARMERDPQERRQHGNHSGRPHRGERKHHERNGGEPRANGHRHRDDRPAHHGKPSRPEHAHAGHHREDGQAPEQRKNEHRQPERRQHERGDRRPSWGSSDAPKFMKRRDDSRGRQSRNPAS